MGKVCKRCGEEKDLSEFGKDKKTSDGIRFYCKQCRRERYREHHPKKENMFGTNDKKIYAKAFHLMKRYNLSLDEWKNLLKEQDYVCPICKEKFTDKICVDHDHITGRVRGLLCDKCNRGIGQFNDNIEKLENAINYLKNNLGGHDA